MKAKSLSCVRLLATPWTAAYQTPPSELTSKKDDGGRGELGMFPEGEIAEYCEAYLKSMAAAAAKSLQSCPTLCDPIDSSPPGSPVPGILQARTLEWGAISFSNA